MQDSDDSNDSYQTIDNPNLFAKTPGEDTPTPKPKQEKAKSPEKEKKPKKQELVVVE
jgi:hypothetical protein